MVEFRKAMEEYKAANPDSAGLENNEGNNGGNSPVPKGKKETEPTSSKKRPKPSSATKSPPGKRGAKKASIANEIEIDAAILKEAETLKLVAQLKNLAARPDVASSGKSPKQMLVSLRENEGLVNKAK